MNFNSFLVYQIPESKYLAIKILVQEYVSDSYGTQVYSKDNGKTIHSKRKWKSVVQKVKQEVVPFVRKSGLFEKTYSTYALDFKVSTYTST